MAKARITRRKLMPKCAIHDEAFKSLQKDVAFIKESQREMKEDQKEMRADVKELLQHKGKMMGAIAAIAIVASGVFTVIASFITNIVKGN